MNPTEDSPPPTPLGGLPSGLPGNDDKLYLKCINVGMGDCSLIIMPNGKRVLVDCGTSRLAGVTVDDVRHELETLLDIILPFDVVVMTHPDRDHYSLIGDMLGDTSIKRLVHSIELKFFSLYKFRTWYWKNSSNIGSTQQVTVNSTSPAEVMLLDGGGGIKLFIVAANVPFSGESHAMKVNTASVVVVARNTNTGENLFLIAADGTCATEDFMLDPARVARIRNVSFIRVGHHGSDTSSRKTFVTATNPSYAALVSSSQNNGRYCLPKQSVVNRWLNKMPDAGLNKTVGYWEDGTGVECSGGTADEGNLDTEPGGFELPYNYGTAQTTKRFYETFLDGTRLISWGPFK